MDRDPELVIRQALRAQAGGPRRPAPDTGTAARSEGGGAWWSGRLTVAQVLLLAAIIGLVIGMAAAFVVLAVR